MVDGSFPIRMIAEILFKLKKYDEAFSFLDKYILELEDEINKSDLYECKSILLIKLEKYDKALDAINKAIKLHQDSKFLYIRKADILYKREEFEESIEVSQEIIDSDARNARTYYIQGKSYYKLKNFSEAKRKFKNALKFAYSEETKYYYYLALCDKALGDFNLANKNFRKGKKIAKENKNQKWIERINKSLSEISKNTSK